MAETTSIFASPYLWVMGIAVVIIIIYKLKTKKDDRFKFDEFEGKPLKSTLRDELNGKLDILGIRMKRGRLHLGFNGIGRIDKYGIFKGRLPISEYDPKTKEMTIGDPADDVQQTFIIIRLTGANFFSRLFGVGKKFLLLKYEDIKVDHRNRRIFLPHGLDLMSYGDVWINSDLSYEYLNDISLKRMLEQMTTHTENMPDRIVMLETDLAKRERLAKTFAEIESNRYDKRKTVDDTNVAQSGG